jgi:hypothetical protein
MLFLLLFIIIVVDYSKKHLGSGETIRSWNLVIIGQLICMEDKDTTTGHYVSSLVNEVPPSVDHATKLIVKFAVSATDH